VEASGTAVTESGSTLTLIGFEFGGSYYDAVDAEQGEKITVYLTADVRR
jgi:hypothetical protein